ncbi:alpha/beta hydrolase [Siculibacillus lacustris]|uniref:Alpha/beta hydrolase n=1 Tax=Siculibacillus lacustris TaxID=1549641 RepID=A0A4Q9VN73_9HYPH|nr:alpha/beta hydrolase [Siculibacillus lacustris]TBW36993.1 alpha/beta hydrolase [Siculibacillus lacustris]
MSTDAAIDPALDHAYGAGQRRPHWPALLERFAAASEAVAAGPGVLRDLAYGPHPRQRLDLVPAVDARAIVVWLHPGYWQSRDRTLFRFLAPTFTALGCDAVFADYPLCPEVTVAELTEALRALVPALVAQSEVRHGRPLPIVAAGHSAGGHLAIELAATDWAARGLAPAPIAAVIGVSGVYDLAPLVATALNANLRLDLASARAASPLHRVPASACPALFAVGGAETPAFLDQSRAMAAAWGAAGHGQRLEITPGDDHFTVLTTLADPASPLHGALAATIAGATA